MAQGFFKNIPNINYDFKSDGQFSRAKDLFRKVSVWSYLREGVSGYNYYRIQSGERADVTASRLYGDSTLYWTFFLVNENLQDLNDWPKSQTTLHRFIARKYSGTVLNASSSTDIVSFNHDTNVSSKFLMGEKVTQSTTDAYGFVTKVDPTHNRVILNSITGIFDTSSVVGSESEKTFTPSSVVDEKDVVHHYIDSDDLITTVSTGNTPVSNEKYERDLNEDRHIIRYIEPKYIADVVDEFKEIIRD